MQNNDEDFVASLRPENTFGVLGEYDHFDVDDEDPYDERDVAEPTYQSLSNQSQPRAVGGFPIAVSGAGEEPPSKMGAAISLFFVLGGAGLGWHYGEFKGAAGGALVAGALRNLYRTHQTIKAGGDAGSAVKQGIVGLVGVGVGGYLLWAANSKQEVIRI